MHSRRKRKVRKQNSQIKPYTKKRRTWFAIAFALYVTFILLSTIPFLAHRTIQPQMQDTYVYHLTYPQDGRQTHYYVERVNTNNPGRIVVTYKTASNSLIVNTQNVKVLHIYCRSMYEDECKEVFGIDPYDDSNYYKWYFIEKDHLNVKVDTDSVLEELSFIDTPIPYNVTVNSQEWWLTSINYTYNNDDTVLTKVPKGHTNVDIYFKSNNLNSPVARFTTSKNIIGVGETVSFNASSSYDPDGTIISYIWDLGDGTHKIGKTTEHKFVKEGVQKVILTVKDDDYLIDRAYQDIIVVKRVMSISKSVDKPIATPGSILTYTLIPYMNTTWKNGLKDVIITDDLPDYVEYIDATPKPQLNGRTLTWKFYSISSPGDLHNIILETKIDTTVENNTIISNYASLNYKGLDNQDFPEEFTNLITTKINTESILAPKILTPVPNIQLREDDPPFDLWLSSYEYDFKDSVYNLKWYITGENESLYILSGEYSNNDVLTITPLPNAYGNNLVTLWLVDSEGYTASQPLWINITPVNDKPIFSPAPDLIIHFSEDYTFNYEPYIFDIDTPYEKLYLFASMRNSSGDGSRSKSRSTNIKVNGFKVTYHFPENYIDKHVLVSLIIFDGNSSDGDTIQINITDDYTPILKNELPDIWLNEGETLFNVFDLDEYFDDPDKDSLFYSYGETHISVIINENHTVDITSPPDWNGLDTVTFRARDPIGAIAEDTILVTVIPINDPPIIEGVPEIFVIHYDYDFSFDLRPYIFDEDNTLDELSLIITDEYIRIDPSNHLKIILNYPKSLEGAEIPVILMVSDGIDTGFQIISVRVTNNWPPEIIKKLPDVAFYEDNEIINAFNLDEYFTDRDSVTLFYSYGQEFVNVTINSDNTVDFSAFKDWFGLETVTFRATDSNQAFVESVITVTVNPVNDPPIIQPLPGQHGIVKQLWKFDLTKYLNDVDNDITDLTINISSSKLDIMVSGREIIFYSDKPVEDNIIITVSDGYAETTETMLIEVKDDGSASKASVDFLMSILWLLILIIVIIISLIGFVGWRKYVGNYKIEEIYWIYENGVLISHMTFGTLEHQAEKEIISGMLTAILDFSEDAFSDKYDNKKPYRIKEIQMDGKNILLEKGKYTLLATVFSGSSGKKLYSKSRRSLSSVEEIYENILKGWKGEAEKLDGAEHIIRKIKS